MAAKLSASSLPPQVALVDAGPLIAWFDRNDIRHKDVLAFFHSYTGSLHTTWPVVNEVCHFLGIRQQRAFLAWLRQGGAHLAQVEEEALDRFDLMLENAADQPVDLADASLLWLGEKLRVNNIITLDSSDFPIYRTAAGKPLRNLLAAN